jgi:hypothetical protein
VTPLHDKEGSNGKNNPRHSKNQNIPLEGMAVIVAVVVVVAVDRCWNIIKPKYGNEKQERTRKRIPKARAQETC